MFWSFFSIALRLLLPLIWIVWCDLNVIVSLVLQQQLAKENKYLDQISLSCWEYLLLELFIMKQGSRVLTHYGSGGGFISVCLFLPFTEKGDGFLNCLFKDYIQA